MSNRKSAGYLRERLSQHEDAIKAYTGETLYHVQVDFTCQLLDAVDEVADAVTAQMITDVIYERLTGDGVSEAAQRQREHRAMLEQIMRNPMPSVYWPPEGDHG